jgi:hypothetical protein
MEAQVPNSAIPTEPTPPTAEQMNEQYQNGLTELMENKKLGLLTQDQFDQQHRDLIEKVFGKPKEE